MLWREDAGVHRVSAGHEQMREREREREREQVHFSVPLGLYSLGFAMNQVLFQNNQSISQASVASLMGPPLVRLTGLYGQAPLPARSLPPNNQYLREEGRSVNPLGKALL